MTEIYAHKNGQKVQLEKLNECVKETNMKPKYYRVRIDPSSILGLAY